MMKQLLVVAGLIAVISGCSSIDPAKLSSEMPAVKPLLVNKPYAELNATDQRTVIESELRTIGRALQAYAADHKGELPPTLTALVKDNYLKASDLISSADPTKGKEGGVPDKYSAWGQAEQADEAGSSYLYEFSSVSCGWDWKTYVAGEATPEKLDINKDKTVSWAEVKTWQMKHGDTVQQPKGGYPKNRFPVVRCYWYQYPDAYSEDATKGIVISLAADLKTVFSSQPWWEKDFSK
jgi:hypothetical protein